MYFKHFIMFIVSCFFINTIYSQKQSNFDWQALFNQSYFTGFRKLPPLRQYWIGLSNSKAADDMESLSYGMDAILAMFEATKDTTYLNDAITITNDVIKRSQITKDIPGNKFLLKDNYRGWIGAIPNGYQYQEEVVLSEIYFFQYATRLLKDIHNNSIYYDNRSYRAFYETTLSFIEINIWDKWKNRGIKYNGNKYNYLFLARTHMTSHWAYIAAELYFLTADSSHKKEYFTFDSLYNIKLENNFIRYDGYISWNQTWDIKNHLNGIVQDVSHGNLVVSYIVEAYDLGLWKDSDAIQRIINTLKDKLWDPKDCLFRDNIDGSMFGSGPHSSVGSFQADGFVKLTRYDRSLFSIYNKFIGCSRFLTVWVQHGQLFANLALSEKILEDQNK